MAIYLMQIDAIRQKFEAQALSKQKLKILQASTRKDLCHYFRHLEALPKNVHKIELAGYLQAFDTVSVWIKHEKKICESRIQKLHALLFNSNSKDLYRNEQNAVFNESMRKVLYLPPKAQEVPKLMKELIRFISRKRKLAPPLIAGIAHFGLNSIHPYYDGNGRTARLLTRWVLGLYHYDLDGLYCLERMYCKNLQRYYSALNVTQQDRMNCDITSWLEYFLEGMRDSFQYSLRQQALS